MEKVPYGYCQCGCGQKTKISKKTRVDRHIIKGQPYKFIKGHHNRIDLKGQKFGRLTVIRPTNERCFGRVVWLCRCDCGAIVKIDRGNLMNGSSRSCGCLKRAPLKERRKASDYHVNGERSGTYICWGSMRQRCNNPKNPNYKDYGGRGIVVCERWNDYKNFLKDMGKRPEGLTLERIENDGNYEPENCKWVSMIEQGRNRRNVKLDPSKTKTIKKLLRKGELKLKEIAEMFHVTTRTIQDIKREKTWVKIK